jgi:hypothetical protein
MADWEFQKGAFGIMVHKSRGKAKMPRMHEMLNLKTGKHSFYFSKKPAVEKKGIIHIQTIYAPSQARIRQMAKNVKYINNNIKK